MSYSHQGSPYLGSHDKLEPAAGPLTANRSRLSMGSEHLTPPGSSKSYRSATGSTYAGERRFSGAQELYAGPGHNDVRGDVLNWVEQVVGLVLPHNDHDLREHLRDGVILCKLLHSHFPEAIQFYPEVHAEEEARHNVNTFLEFHQRMNPPHDWRLSREDLEYGGFDDRPRVVMTLYHLMQFTRESQQSPLPGPRGLNRDVINIVDQDGSSPASATSQRSVSTSKHSASPPPPYRVTSPPNTDNSLMPLRSYGSPVPMSSAHQIAPLRAATDKSVQAAAGVTKLMQQCTAMLRDRMYEPNRQPQLQYTPPGPARYLSTSVSSPEVPAASLDGLGPVLENVLGSLTQEYEKRLLAKDHELSNARDRIKILEHNLATREEELAREQEQAELRGLQLRQQAAQLSANDLADMMSTRNSLQEQVMALQVENQEFKSRLEQVDREHELRTAALQARSAELQEQLAEYADIYERYEDVKRKNRELYNEIQDLKGSIRVFCRIRPPGLTGDLSVPCTDVGVEGELAIYEPGSSERRVFNFDRVYDVAASQQEVYEDTQPLVRSVLDGYNVCIFAYGQTGSGKTHTMSGTNVELMEGRGINYRALDDLFSLRDERAEEVAYDIQVQMLEIYNDNLRDLLSSDPTAKLDIMTAEASGENVPGVVCEEVHSPADVLRIMAHGAKNRATSGTKMNDRSSRSHQVVTVVVRGENLRTGERSHACLHLVDLAGSERVGKSEAAGDRLVEAQHINKSLSALGDVMAALANKKAGHVPYRNSKLTLLLEKSLSGAAKVMMLVHVSPEESSFNESVTTLKFGCRVSEITLGKPKRNGESSKLFRAHEEAQHVRGELARLQAALEASNGHCSDVARQRDDALDEVFRLKDLLQQQRQPQVDMWQDRGATSSPSTLDAYSEPLPMVPRLALHAVPRSEEHSEHLDTVSPLVSARTLSTPHRGDSSPYANSASGTPKSSSRLPAVPKLQSQFSNLGSGSKPAVERSSSVRRSSMSGPLPAPPLLRSTTMPVIRDAKAPTSARTSGVYRPSTGGGRTSSAGAGALAASIAAAPRAERTFSGSKTARTSGVFGGSTATASPVAAAIAARPSTAGAGSGAAAPSGSRTARSTASSVAYSGLATSRTGGVFARTSMAAPSAAAAERPGNLTSRRSSAARWQ